MTDTALMDVKGDLTSDAGPILDDNASVVVDQVKAQELAQSIDLSSAVTVLDFGKDIGTCASNATDTLLAKAQLRDVEELGTKLTHTIAEARTFDVTAIHNRWSTFPLIGIAVRRFSKAKDKAMRRFTSLESQIDDMMHAVDSASDTLAAQGQTVSAMIVQVREECIDIATHYHAAEIRLEAENQKGTKPAGYQALLKRRDDLKVLEHASLQMLPMLRVMEGNAAMLREKFQTIKVLTIPAWKRAFAIALALDEQRDAVALAENIDDATNYFLKRNADMMNENAVATTLSNQRLTVDIETLKHVHAKTIQTLDDVRSAETQGALERSESLKELKALREAMQLA